MKVINVRNVSEALASGIRLMKAEGEKLSSRNGTTLEIPEPVTTTYHLPWERVITCPVRDANPFFHLMESLWIIKGRQDVKFLNEFNKRMVDYSDDGIIFNAPYGHRIRNHGVADQLEQVIDTLALDPTSRQAVCQIWDQNDLMKDTKDKACNMSIVFRIRNGELCITVYNRSNDMIWGAYGANAVQFSMIQEYVAARLGIPMGTYDQVSNSFHVYLEGPGGALWDKLEHYHSNVPQPIDIYEEAEGKDLILMDKTQMREFDRDLIVLFSMYDKYGLSVVGEMKCWESDYFNKLVIPMISVFLVYKRHGAEVALRYSDQIEAHDWRTAVEYWLCNRVKG